MTRILTAWADGNGERVSLKRWEGPVADNSKEQWEHVNDYIREEREQRRLAEIKAAKKDAKRKKYAHQKDESLLKFIWKELMG